MLFYILAERGIDVPKKLNDTQVQSLVLEHANGTSISALAKKYKIDWNTAKKYIENSREIQEEFKTIKNETITEWIKNNSSDLAGLLDDIKEALRGKIKDASVKELFGGLKILTDLGINAKDVFGGGEKDQKGIKFEFTDTSIEGVSNE